MPEVGSDVEEVEREVAVVSMLEEASNVEDVFRCGSIAFKKEADGSKPESIRWQVIRQQSSELLITFEFGGEERWLLSVATAHKVVDGGQVGFRIWRIGFQDLGLDDEVFFNFVLQAETETFDHFSVEIRLR